MACGETCKSSARIFDQKYSVEGIESPIRLRIKDVIFVMEDVDAASKVVHRGGASKGVTLAATRSGRVRELENGGVDEHAELGPHRTAPKVGEVGGVA